MMATKEILFSLQRWAQSFLLLVFFECKLLFATFSCYHVLKMIRCGFDNTSQETLGLYIGENGIK
eukprot:snap_masked-scaffold_7-processed-gene-14.27-mRNA-1 protein AED:1.00 eAED:1.00 QI:0/0/0/0/1/1/3/0/64